MADSATRTSAEGLNPYFAWIRYMSYFVYVAIQNFNVLILILHG